MKMKKQYWPKAVALDNGKPSLLFTDKCEHSILACEKIFQRWQNDCGYVLLVTWIQVTDDDAPFYIIEHHCHVDTLGHIRSYE